MCVCVCVCVCACVCVCVVIIGEPPNKGHFGDNIDSADLFFAERGFPLWELQNVL